MIVKDQRDTIHADRLTGVPEIRQISTTARHSGEGLERRKT